MLNRHSFAIALLLLCAFVPPAIAQATTTSLIEAFFRRPRGEGIRRGGICVIAPATDALQPQFMVWSDRPLFLWRTNSNEVEVLHIQVWNEQTDEIVWDQDLSPTDQQVLYAGSGLEPGSVYSWELRWRVWNEAGQQWSETAQESAFQVMPAEQRSQIATALQAVLAPYKSASTETIAIQQAQYLIEQGLASDGLQTLYAVENPSAELVQMTQQFTESICHPDETNQS